jgi:hypothetical protein
MTEKGCREWLSSKETAYTRLTNYDGALRCSIYRGKQPRMILMEYTKCSAAMFAGERVLAHLMEGENCGGLFDGRIAY